MNYNNFCESKKCPYYKIWDFGEGDCQSCTLIGQSYFVDKYPSNCKYLTEIKKHEKLNDCCDPKGN